MPKNSGLTSVRFLFVFFCVHLSGCTEKLTSYTPPEGEVQWIDLDKDSLKGGVAFFARVDNEMLVASAEVYTKFGELDYYKLFDISFAELDQDTARIKLILRNQYQMEELQFVDSTWETAIRQLRSVENMDDTLSVVLSYERLYRFSSLPGRLQLNYRIATQDTLVTGFKSFEAVETEVPSVIRWH